MSDERTINDDVLTVLPELTRAELERVATALLEQSGYLDEHSHGDEGPRAGRHSCTGETWHRCSLGRDHEPDCDGTCGRTGKPCTTSVELHCHVSGFDCPDCALVNELAAIVATAYVRRNPDSRAREPEAVTPLKERDQSVA